MKHPINQDVIRKHARTARSCKEATGEYMAPSEVSYPSAIVSVVIVALVAILLLGF